MSDYIIRLIQSTTLVAVVATSFQARFPEIGNKKKKEYEHEFKTPSSVFRSDNNLINSHPDSSLKLCFIVHIISK